MPIIVVFLIFFAEAATAQQAVDLPTPPVAQQPPFFVTDPHPETWWRDAQIVQALHLSDAQISRIEEIFQNNHETINSLSAEIELVKKKSKDAVNVNEFVDPVRIREIASSITKLDSKLSIAKAKMQVSCQKELSEEQRQMFHKMQTSHAKDAPKLIGSMRMGENPARTDSGKPVYSLSDVPIMPQIVHNPMPSYTEEARAKRVEGVVVLSAIINKEGRAQGIKIIRSLGYGLDESAVNTIAKQWIFTPAFYRGKPMEVQIYIDVTFRLY
jgi:TonB family protein